MHLEFNTCVFDVKFVPEPSPRKNAQGARQSATSLSQSQSQQTCLTPTSFFVYVDLRTYKRKRWQLPPRTLCPETFTYLGQ